MSINKISNNLIELKLIEPKLISDKIKIKEYKKLNLEYNWLGDIIKTETSKVSIFDETKELSKLIKHVPDVKGLISTNDISENEILQMLVTFANKPPKGDYIISEDDKNIYKKLNNKDNFEKFKTILEKKYTEPKIMCLILSNIKGSVDVGDLFRKYFTDKTCNTILTERQESKPAPAPYVPRRD